MWISLAYRVSLKIFAVAMVSIVTHKLTGTATSKS